MGIIIVVGAYYSVFTLHGIKFFNLFNNSYRIIILCFSFNKFISSTFCKYDGRTFSFSSLVGFSWTMFNSTNSLIILLGTIPLFVIFLLFFLETGVAMVQSVVFTILACMYMDEAVSLSH